MLSILVYLVGCAFASILLSSLYLAFRPLKNIDEQAKPWIIMIIGFILTISAPYAFVEMQTKKHRLEFADAVGDAYNEADVKGTLKYFKVVQYSDTKAKVIAVGQEDNEFSGMEHPVISVEMSKTTDGWTASSYTVLASTRLNQDRLVFPPYF